MTKKAIQSFAKDYPEGEGWGQYVVSEDDLYADDHKFVKWSPTMFVDHTDGLTVHESDATRKKTAKVEQATAAPGESRDVEKPAK